jgi:hypothetical protein
VEFLWFEAGGCVIVLFLEEREGWKGKEERNK